MKYTTYKNFSLKSQTEFEKYIICTNSKRQFHFANALKIFEKYLYTNLTRIQSKTSLKSTTDGDAVIFFVDDDYTVSTGTTITTTNRCKGLYMFINGTLTNNGTISMTARGANAEGRFVTIDTN
jgi:hypothetical protein